MLAALLDILSMEGSWGVGGHFRRGCPPGPTDDDCTLLLEAEDHPDKRILCDYVQFGEKIICVQDKIGLGSPLWYLGPTAHNITG